MARKDVLVTAPTAVFYLPRGPFTGASPAEGLSEKDVIQMQEAEIAALRSELTKLQATANTIANTAAALAAMSQPDHEGWVTVPRELRERMKDDVKLSVRSTPEGTQLRWVTRPKDHSFEGRADG